MSLARRILSGGLALLVLPALLSWAAPALAEGGEGVETATFSMYCYWTGEASLGRVDGVVASRIGHWGGDEIVQVDYDPQRTNLGQLVRALSRQSSFDALVVTDRHAEELAAKELGPIEVSVRGGEPHFIDAKHSLRTRHPDLYALDLNEAQAIALNSWSYFGGPMPDVLTPAQKKRIEGH